MDYEALPNEIKKLVEKYWKHTLNTKMAAYDYGYERGWKACEVQLHSILKEQEKKNV